MPTVRRQTKSPQRDRASVHLGGGTPGGLGFGSGRQGRPSVLSGLIPTGDAAYLWALVILELLAIGWLRSAFKRYHGG